MTPAEQAHYECLRESASVPQVAAPTPPPPRPQGFTNGVERGLYYSAVGEWRDQRARADEIYTLCMRSRGFQPR